MKIFIVLSAALALSMARPSGLLAPHLAYTAYTGAGPSGTIVSSISPGYVAANGPAIISAGAPGVVATHGPAVVSARFATAPVAVGVGGPVAVGVGGPLTSQYQAQDFFGQYSYGYASPLSSKTEVKTFDGVTRGGYAYLDAEGKVQAVSYTSDALNGFQVAATNLPVAPVPVAVPALVAPVQVSDTAEVAAAKAAHIAALAEANAKATSSDDTETVDAAKTGDSGAADGSSSADTSASADASASADGSATTGEVETTVVQAKAAETPANAVKLNEIHTGAIFAPAAHLGVVGAPGALLAATPYGFHHGLVGAAPGVAFPHALGYSHLFGGPIISPIPAVGNVEVKASSGDAAEVKAAVTTAEVQGVVDLTAAGVPADTPEVAQAKAAHLAAVEAEKLKHIGW